MSNQVALVTHLPEFRTDLVPALTRLEMNDFSHDLTCSVSLSLTMDDGEARGLLETALTMTKKSL